MFDGPEELMTKSQRIVSGGLVLGLAVLAVVVVQQRTALTDLREDMWALSRASVRCADLRSEYQAALRETLNSLRRQQILFIELTADQWDETADIADRRNTEEQAEEDYKLQAQAASFRYNEDCPRLTLDSLAVIAR